MWTAKGYILDLYNMTNLPVIVTCLIGIINYNVFNITVQVVQLWQTFFIHISFHLLWLTGQFFFFEKVINQPSSHTVSLWPSPSCYPTLTITAQQSQGYRGAFWCSMVVMMRDYDHGPWDRVGYVAVGDGQLPPNYIQHIVHSCWIRK